MAGGAAAWNGAAEASTLPAQAAPAPTGVLITSAQTDLARTVAAGLADDFSVRLTALTPVETDLPFTASDLEPGEAIDALVRHVQTIVHVGLGVTPDDEREQVDRWPRRTYHLLQAAAVQGVRRVVYLSSLDLVGGYDPRYRVDEDWRPRVEIGSGDLPLQLGEFCCREFARERKLQVIVLRLGHVVRADARTPPADPKWVDERDVVQAVRLAAAADSPFDGRGLQSWSVFHILSDLPDNRFPIERARRLLGYEPGFK